MVKRCHAAQLRFMAMEHQQFEKRVCDGRIVHGHGDLRPEHICLENEPVIFDCIEFSDELRQVDVADELGFLAMECDYLGADRLGQEILDVYKQISSDNLATELTNFYKCHRACVRAKVAALVAEQVVSPHDHDAHERSLAYLNLADRYAAQLGPPTAIVVCGLMGSGKTTLATTLANLLGSDYLSTDAIRRELLGASPTPAAFNEGHYTAESRQHIYNELLRRAAILLRQRVSVVLDGTFIRTAHQEAAVALSRAARAVPLVVHCSCPTELALERIEHRSTGPGLSEARSQLYASQQSEEERLSVADAMEVDTTVILRLQVAAAVDSLRRHSVASCRPLNH